jgi:hypothetical protein
MCVLHEVVTEMVLQPRFDPDLWTVYRAVWCQCNYNCVPLFEWTPAASNL